MKINIYLALTISLILKINFFLSRLFLSWTKILVSSKKTYLYIFGFKYMYIPTYIKKYIFMVECSWNSAFYLFHTCIDANYCDIKTENGNIELQICKYNIAHVNSDTDIARNEICDRSLRETSRDVLWWFN